jgi:hypothetical protein
MVAAIHVLSSRRLDAMMAKRHLITVAITDWQGANRIEFHSRILPLNRTVVAAGRGVFITPRGLILRIIVVACLGVLFWQTILAAGRLSRPEM